MTKRVITLGIMKLAVAGEESDVALDKTIEAATARFNQVVQHKLDIQIESFSFTGLSLTPDQNGYRALDFVQIGINEKTERKLAFMLIITDVEIAAASMSYLLALPSQLTNVAVISTRRLLDSEVTQEDRLIKRLTHLMLQCFGRLLNLKYTQEPTNYLAYVQVPDDLDTMQAFTAAQYQQMAESLPQEANDRYSEGSRFSFVIRHILSNIPRIVRGAIRANPLRLVTKLPTMIATALSVIIVLIFGGETWDFAASVSYSQLAVFVVSSFLAATFVLYRAFSFQLISTRRGQTSESSVVTAAATYLALVLTLICMFIMFGVLMYGVVVFVFPDPLMSTWTSDKDGASLAAHIRLAAFLAAVGVLSGSLGGSADSRSVVRNVLFAADET
ncbi:hypothetical protein ACTXGO_09455 [Psychrobacter sp. T6-1]|uniref:hypothetical protein n=1 Tax=Psychrobacter sp. T6-1 TaxID=3457447 RepID=UPI00293D50FE|nr:hypothetical protein [uncultured Psychrobacter sp.]